MRADATRIDRFYRAPRGRAASAMALRRLTALWPEAKGLDMLGYGFAGPYLEPFREQARRTVCVMPAEQGAVAWPEDGGSLTTLGEEARTPFPDALFDRTNQATAGELTCSQTQR
jgi:hypothetical protein